MKKIYIQPRMEQVEFSENLCDIGGYSTIEPEDVLAKPIKPTTGSMADWDDFEDEEQSCFD